MSTIDPGMEDGIKQSSHNLNGTEEEETSDRDMNANVPNYDAEEERAEEEKEDFMKPSSWWFASTACPLLAGTFGPIASGFNVCALVYEWRTYIPVDGTEEHGDPIPDPAWLVAINVISLLSALIGNFSLLLNMGHRVRFAVAQPITIIGFLTAGVLLIADMAALTSSSTYFLTGQNAPPERHALTGAFYYAIFAAGLYIMIGLLMCITVYGALREYYKKDFELTPAQRTLMLQTMSFMVYLLLGAAVYAEVEGWEYLEAVYWADITLLTVGLGDYSPETNVGRGLLFPFAIGGILIVGLVVGSIRSLVLERGKEKLSARIMEKRRHGAVHNVDSRKQTIRISHFAAVDFSTDPSLSAAQRREEEFNVMRKVQATAERERRWFSLATSVGFALILWFAGAAIFMRTERSQEWSYFTSLYFSFVALLTIGYGDYHPDSNSGRAFFVFWSILAVPSLTILISNMGDTIVKLFTELTDWIGSITVLPGEEGFRATFKALFGRVAEVLRDSFKTFEGPGLFGISARHPDHPKRMEGDEHEQQMLDVMADRLTTHIKTQELQEASESTEENIDQVQKDMHFYHYVLARECRNVQKDLNASPPKQYSWQDWEYFLKLMGNQDDPTDYPGQEHPDILVPDQLRMAPSTGSDATAVDKQIDSKATGASSKPADNEKHQTTSTIPNHDGNVDRPTQIRRWKEAHDKKKLSKNPDARRRLTTMDVYDWSWLSNRSPLMGSKNEADWILERLSAALERELNRQRKGYKRQPPISLSDIRRRVQKSKQEGREGDDAAEQNEEEHLEKAAKSEV